MHPYIIINHTTETFEVILYVNNELHHRHLEDKRHASKYLIFFIDNLLKTNNLSLNDIGFIGVNQGPGLFSTLRSILATVNGLYCASKVNVVGVDGLEVTAAEFYNKKYVYNATFLNAYNNEAHYLISKDGRKILEGCALIDSALLLLSDVAKEQSVYCIGNAVEIHREKFITHPRLKAVIPDDLPLMCSTDAIKRAAYGFHIARLYSGYLLPLHLKRHRIQR